MPQLTRAALATQIATLLATNGAGAISAADVRQVDGDLLDSLALLAPEIATTALTAYTLALADAGRIVEATAADPVTVTIPAEASVAFPVGSIIQLVQAGAGALTVEAAAGVLLNGVDGGAATLDAQWAGAALYKRGADAWAIQGAHGGVA